MIRAMLRRGDIVLVKFPFTNLQAGKPRPALVVSPGAIHQDVILTAISSVIPVSPDTTDYVIDQSHPDFRQTGLAKASVVRVHRLLTVEQRIIARRLGRVSPAIQSEIDARLQIAVGISQTRGDTP